MTDNEQDYSDKDKRIVFTDKTHRHAQFLVRLRNDGLKQSVFFRSLITGYLEQDERILSFLNEFIDQSKLRKNKSTKMRLQGKQIMNATGFSDSQIEDIFDLIAEEHPEL